MCKVPELITIFAVIKELPQAVPPILGCAAIFCYDTTNHPHDHRRDRVEL